MICSRGVGVEDHRRVRVESQHFCVAACRGFMADEAPLSGGKWKRLPQGVGERVHDRLIELSAVEELMSGCDLQVEQKKLNLGSWRWVRVRAASAVVYCTSLARDSSFFDECAVGW